MHRTDFHQAKCFTLASVYPLLLYLQSMAPARKWFDICTARVLIHSPIAIPNNAATTAIVTSAERIEN